MRFSKTYYTATQDKFYYHHDAIMAEAKVFRELSKAKRAWRRRSAQPDWFVIRSSCWPCKPPLICFH